MNKSKKSILEGKRILLGITGGIAAYKVPDLVRLLIKAKADVRVVMTDAAQQFVTPLTMQAISQHVVATDLFDLSQEATIGHIELADWAELLVIAPATADVVARLALGFANDLLTTIALACQAPLLIAPAMNVNMWQHPATKNNVAVLTERGAEIVGPGHGELACGWVGSGRMSEPEEILEGCCRALGPQDLKGLRILVTAGPTYEALDPVRFITNRSTGKMGYALAQAAAWRGADVILVSGPTVLPTPVGVKRIDVESAREMHDKVVAHRSDADVIALVAAVGDYRPQVVSTKKLKKTALGNTPSIQLEENPDILKELGAKKWVGKRKPPFLIGFAAETENIEQHAAAKFQAKGCDLMIANDISEAGSGFKTDTNRVYIVSNHRDKADKPTGEWLPKMTKAEVANAILDKMINILNP